LYVKSRARVSMTKCSSDRSCTSLHVYHEWLVITLQVLVAGTHRPLPAYPPSPDFESTSWSPMSHPCLRTVRPKSSRLRICYIYWPNGALHCGCTPLPSCLKEGVCMSHHPFFWRGSSSQGVTLGVNQSRSYPVLFLGVRVSRHRYRT